MQKRKRKRRRVLWYSQWHRLLWAHGHVHRVSFISWLAILNSSATKGRLDSCGMSSFQHSMSHLWSLIPALSLSLSLKLSGLKFWTNLVCWGAWMTGESWAWLGLWKHRYLSRRPSRVGFYLLCSLNRKVRNLRIFQQGSNSPQAVLTCWKPNLVCFPVFDRVYGEWSGVRSFCTSCSFLWIVTVINGICRL